jgi:preprotein translocase subunit SecG
MFILANGCTAIDIDMIVPAFTKALIDLVKVIIPILLIAYGMIDLAKAVMSNDEKAMKESQGKFIKRIVYAVVIFFIVAIVQLIFGILATASSSSKTGTVSKNSITACIACFISDNSECKNYTA